MKALCSALLLMAMSVLPVSAAEKIQVSSFSTVLTEVAEKVGGELVQVTGHVKPGDDPHEYEPTPQDLRSVANADLILLSAKHMEGYVDKLTESTATKGKLLEVGNQFPSLKMKAGDHDHGPKDKKAEPAKKEHAHGHAHGHAHDELVEDPHWWHSATNVQRAARVVRDALIKIRPASKAAFTANAAKYTAELDALQKWAKVRVAELPRDQRKLVTSHDAFQYFAKENGFTVYAIEGLSTADQPSSKKVAEIISTIKKQRVKAIFAEALQNKKVLEEITKETGAKLGGTLYADGLGEGEAGTYAGMYRHNVNTIVDALK